MEQQYTNSWFCVLLIALHITAAGIIITIPLTVLNPITPVLQKIYNETYMSRYGEPMSNSTWTALLSITMSMIFVGAFVSSIFFKVLMDRLTRKKIMIIVHITNLAGEAITAIGGAIWGSYEAIIIGRFVTGLSIGVGVALTGVTVSELTVPHRRLLYNAVVGGKYPVGALFGAIIGWPKALGSEDLWWVAIILPSFMSFVYLAAAYWIPETPYQTMLIAGSDDAVKVLEKLRIGSKDEMYKELQSMGGSLNDKSKTKEEADEATFSEVVKTPHYRKHFFGCIIVYTYIMACGMPNIVFFSDRIFLAAGLSMDAVTPATIGVLTIGPVVSCIAVVAMKKFDGRTILLFGSVVMIVGDAFITASLATYERVPAMTICSIAAMAIYFFGFSLCNTSAYGLISILCITRTRSVCMFMATLVFWFFGWIVGFISPYFAEWMGAYAFIVWMAVAIGAMMYIIIFVPETKGKTEDEIQEFYK